MSIDKKDVIAAADIVTIIGKRTKLKKEGDNYIGLCPFHNEKSPSFKVSPEKKIYKCFGCGRSGDVIKFIQEFDRVDFQGALEIIAADAGVKDTAIAADIKKIYTLPDPRPDHLSKELFQYLLIERHISHDTIDKLKITGSMEFMIEAKASIPVMCFNYYVRGRLTNIKFRGANKEMQLAKSAELVPYNVDSIKGTSVASITEGEIDCATLVECGIDQATSCPNGGTKKNPNISWVGKHYDKKDKIILFTDDDESGRGLRDKLTRRLGYHRVLWVKYPDGCKDINDVFVKHGAIAVREVYSAAYPAPLPEVVETMELDFAKNVDPDKYLSHPSVLASGKISYKPNLPGILKWAKNFGFSWIRYAIDEDSPVMLIRHANKIIYIVTEQDVLHEYLKEIDLNYSDDNSERMVLYNYASTFIRQLPSLAYFDQEILADTRDTAYLCFENGVLAVKAASLEFLQYADFPHFVFSKYIINHEYEPYPSDGNFKDFLFAVSVDADHYASNLSAIGYLLHSYKLRTTAKAVVIVEDVDDESEARGRSGKGLIAQFIELFKNTIQQDGRNYKTDDKFKLQRVDISTQIFYLNDPAPGLLLNQFYNMITDDFFVEAKGKKSYSIPFKKSPKLLVTTNHLPALTSDSDRERFCVVSIKKAFGTSELLGDRFPGVLFFDRDHWANLQFQAAFCLAVEALQLYLEEGIISYTNPEMAANASKRRIATQVPECVGEPISQVLAIRQEVDNPEMFAHSLTSIDLSPYRDMLAQAFHFDKDGVDIWLTPFYRYATIVLKAKISQAHFGRKIRFFLEESKIRHEERRSNTTGKKLTLYVSNQQTLKLID